MGQKTANNLRVTYSATDSNTARTINTTAAQVIGDGVTASGSNRVISFKIGAFTVASVTAASTSVMDKEAAIETFLNRINSGKAATVTIQRQHSSVTAQIVLEVFGESASSTTTVPAKPSYKVSYNANGGSGAPSAQTKWYGETLTLSSSKPTRTGYTFKGWGTSSSATSASYQPGGSYTANSGTTLYAIWQINTYTVSYANGGHGTAPASQTKTYGANLTLRAGLGTVSNYYFSKWKATDGTLYSGGGTYSKNAGTTMTAQWIAPYTVSYDGNGATGGSTEAQTKVHNATLALRSNGFTRTNHTFAGWNTKSDGSGTPYSSGANYTANASVKLYAKWTQVYASPSLTIQSVYRADSEGNVSDEGEYLALEASYSIYDTGDNAISSWSVTCNDVTSSTPVSGGTGLSGSVKFIVAANLSTENQYTVTLALTDTKGGTSGRSDATTVKSALLGSAAYPLDFYRFNDGQYGVAVGGVVTRKGLDVFGDAYFRKSVNLANALPIAQGGSGQTGTIKKTTGVIDASSSATITAQQYAQWGKVAMVNFSFKPTSAIAVPADGNMENITLGTLKEAYRPAYNTSVPIPELGGVANIYANGQVQVANLNARGAAYTISTDKNIYVRGTYVLA